MTTLAATPAHRRAAERAAERAAAAARPPSPLAPDAQDPLGGWLHLRASAKDLLAEVRFVATAIDTRRPSVPVLAGVLLQAVPGGIRLTGYDYDRVATSVLPAPGARGTAVLPAGPLLRMLSVVGTGDVVLEVTPSPTDAPGSGQAGLQGVDATYSFPALPVQDYPQRPVTGEHLIAVLDATARRRIAASLVATCTDETLPVLRGVQLHVYDGQLAATATDRYRLHVADHLAPALLDGDAAWLTPRAPLAAALRAFTKHPTVELRASHRAGQAPAWSSATTAASRAHDRVDAGHWVQWEAGNRTYAIRLTHGEYPKVRALLPTTRAFPLVVDRAAALAALRRVAVIAARGMPVELSVGAGAPQVGDPASGQSGEHRLWMSVGKPGQDETAYASLPVHDTSAQPDGASAAAQVASLGPDWRMAFNPAYLADALASVTGDHVTFDITSPTKPAVLTGSNDPHSRHLLMPVRLAG